MKCFNLHHPILYFTEFLAGDRRDNVFIERLWRSLKYECVYLHEFEDGRQARQTIADWLQYFNEDRPHFSLAGNRTPMEACTR